MLKPLFWNKLCVLPTGTVSSTGTSTVTRATGSFFRQEWQGQPIIINGITYTVQTVTLQNTMTVSPTPSAQTGVAMSFGSLPGICQGRTYYGVNVEVKNDIEFKNGQRVFVEGNIENDWEGQSDQFGEIFHINSLQNQLSPLPGEVMQNFTIRRNILAHGNKCFLFGVLGYSTGALNGGGSFSVHDNLCDDINAGRERVDDRHIARM